MDPVMRHLQMLFNKTITESGLLEKGMDSSFCHIA